MLATIDAYSCFIFVQLACLTVCIACIFFLIDLVILNHRWQFFAIHFYNYFHEFQQLKHLSFDICIVIIGLLSCTSSPFVYCFFGNMATECYFKMGDCLYESNWYNLSNDFKKYFILMIANMHHPLYYHGSEMIILNLTTFQEVRAKSAKCP